MHYVRVACCRTLGAKAFSVRALAIAFIATLLSIGALQASAQVRYYYDELGRLVEAVAPDGQSAQYTYDALGNILSISRLGTATVSISEFTPNAGPVGTTVTIYGSGYSTNPASNAVAFNGTAAAVNAATATSLVVTVPAGATSGPISVSNSNGSATTTAVFTVGAVSAAPTITSFTPDTGGAGTVVSVTGTNFQLAPANNKATLGDVAAPVVQDSSSPTATLLKLAVPNGDASGKISISTPYGKAVSAADFYALPSTVNAADVAFRGRLAVDGASINVVTASPGKKAVLLFDATTGQQLHLLSASGTFASGISVAVYAPNGIQVESLAIGNQSFVNFANRVSTGTYTIILSPQSTDSGTVSLSLVADVTGTLLVDGSTPVSLIGGRSGHFSFMGQAGKGYGLALTNFSITPVNWLGATLRNANGNALNSCANAAGTCTFPSSLFTSTGMYTIDFVPPSGTSAATFNASFSVDTGGALTVDAPATTMTIARAGQNGRYTFSATAGDLVNIVISNMVGITNGATVALYRPSDGAAVSQMYLYDGSGGSLGVTLPQTGTYTFLVDPWTLDTGSVDVNVKSYATGLLAVDGVTAVNLSAGRTGRYSFTAEAGKGYGLGLTNFTITPANWLSVTLRDANANTLSYCYVYGGSTSCNFDPSLFASAGTYMIDFVPGVSAATFNASFSADTGGALTVDAPATTMTVARAGQNGRYTFSATANDLVNIVISNMVGITNGTTVTLYRPSDGAAVSQMYVYNGGGGSLGVTLPQTGTYTFLVDPWALDTGSVDVNVKSYATGLLAVDGVTAVNLSAGRTGRYSFTAEAGKGYGLGLTGYTITPDNWLYVTLRDANANALSYCNIYGGGGRSCTFDPSLFASAGTYVIDFVPGGVSAATFSAAFSKDTGGALTVDAPATTMTVARAGQNGRYTFSGTANDVVNIVISNMVGITNGATVALYRPSDGALINQMYLYNGSGGSLGVTLPQTGTYTFLVDPWTLDTGSVDVRVTH